MASKYPDINEQASQHIHLPADYIPFTEPAASRVGYTEPELRTYPQPRPLPPSHTHLTPEAVLREIEKKRIREEIIMAEIVRRRVLEAEVRQELINERKLASQKGIPIGFPLSSSVMGFKPPIRLPLLGTAGESWSLEERIVPCIAKERLRRNGHQGRGFEPFPFQRRSDGLGISDARPAALEGPKEKKKIVWLDKPYEDVAGSKRRASTPPARLDSSKPPTKDVGIISTKKAKPELFCSVCHISANSEQALNEHLTGRKHKSKEATLIAQRARKNYCMGFFPKNATQSIEVPVIADSSSTPEIPRPQTDPEKDRSVVPEALKKVESTKNRFRFWCETCMVGSNSKKVLNDHMMGRKHAKRLEESPKI